MRYTTTVSYRKSIFASMLLAFAALLSNGASAGVIHGGLDNADFSAGFDEWIGEIATYDHSADPTLADSGIGVATSPLDTNYPANFSLPSGGEAKISTSATFDVDTYFVSLFQNFTVDSIAAGSTLGLSLGVTSALTDPFNGAVQLIDLGGGLATLDLTAGGIFDITAWAGVSAQFALFVADDDFTLPSTSDMITVSGITFTETVAAVPEPSSLLLFGLGLAGLWSKRRCIRLV